MIERIKAETLCSGIGAPETAMPDWDWRLAAEIDAFPRSILQRRFAYADVRHFARAPSPRLWGDFTGLKPRHYTRFDIPTPDVIVAGTPCQAFSFAGKRGGLQDPRGGLTIAFVRHCHAIKNLARARGARDPVVVWENVPGVLSDADNAFGCFLGALVGSDAPIPSPRGERWPDAGMVSGPWARAAWRVLDAQYFGLAQRRRRVFVVVDFGGRADPAAVLFERRSVSRNSPPSRDEGADITGAITARAGKCGRGGSDENDAKQNRLIPVAMNLRGRDGGSNPEFDDVASLRAASGGSSRSYVAFSAKNYGQDDGEISPALRAMGHDKSHANGGGQIAIAFQERGRPGGRQIESQDDQAYALTAPKDGGRRNEMNIATSHAVRRLTPVECERLQGFPDHFTAIPWRGRAAEDCPDGPRYKALGNSMAVPVLRWILTRVEGEIS